MATKDPPNIFEEDLVYLNDDPTSLAIVTKGNTNRTHILIVLQKLSGSDVSGVGE